jgi:hypothetical protein
MELHIDKPIVIHVIMSSKQAKETSARWNLSCSLNLHTLSGFGE